MSDKQIHIVHLYPKEMNIYGDTGNTLALRRRLEWRDIAVKVSLVGVGDDVPRDADIIIGGGGQDAGQDKIQGDLQEKSEILHKMAASGVVMFMVCGMYQLFGRSFTTSDRAVIKGIGILSLETVAGPTRLIGNTLYDSPYGEIVGYENHSGLTYLDDPKTALATVVKGAGNNGQDKTEGCRVQNIFGTYSHGPALVKNPAFADTLLQLAIDRKYPEAKLAPIDNTLELTAHQFAKQRPR
jgi:CobQ-like glutamine amidotransferase family enzyme